MTATRTALDIRKPKVPENFCKNYFFLEEDYILPPSVNMSSTIANFAAVLPSAGSDLIIEERAIPSPGADEVLIRNHAIAVNPVDWKRQFLNLYISSYPAILGTGKALR